MGFFSNLFGGKNSSSGAEADMKYCPKCGDEYRADFSTCAHCHVELESDYKKTSNGSHEDLLKKRSMKFSKTDKLVRLQKGPMKDIKHLAMVLANNRIPSVLESDDMSMGGG